MSAKRREEAIAQFSQPAHVSATSTAAVNSTRRRSTRGTKSTRPARSNDDNDSDVGLDDDSDTYVPEVTGSKGKGKTQYADCNGENPTVMLISLKAVRCSSYSHIMLRKSNHLSGC